MRRHAATFVAAALLFAVIAGPVAAAGGSRASGDATGGITSGASLRDPADPTGRWIVLYKAGTDAAAATRTRSVRDGFHADRTFTHGLRGFSAALSPAQVNALRHDPAVSSVVPDERIEVEGQSIPTGISRIGARLSAAAKIDGIDDRVDADVAILDTGIAKVPDLNVVGGYDCSTSNHARWRDVYGHGTHVAGTVGAIDNGSGVVGVAPGVRLWAVKVIDDTGSGMLSWYACGIDWVFAQHDPLDPSKPLFEAVNMSITKWGHDDGACGTLNDDLLHAAICRLVKSGVTVVAAAANDSGNASLRVPGSYDEVITVSALADTDGKPGGLGGHRCYSWGGYDTDDTFADFSNYGADVDLIAPGKCIWSTVPGGGYKYMSGTSMAAPHVTGAVALLKSTRPYFTPAEVKEALQYLGTYDWRTTTDPDSTHEKLLDVSRLGPRGDFGVTVSGTPTISTSGGTATFMVTLDRDLFSFERITLSAKDLPRAARPTFAKPSLYGFEGVTTKMTISIGPGLTPGTHSVTVVGDEHGRRRQGTGTFLVTGPVVAPPPGTDQGPRGLAGNAPRPPKTVGTGSVGFRTLPLERAAQLPDPGTAAPASPAPGTAPRAAKPVSTTATGETTSDTPSAPAPAVTAAREPAAAPQKATAMASHRIHYRNTFVIAC